MFFKGSPPALKETNRLPEATRMEGNNNHALTPAIFVLVRPSAHPDPCDTAANKKRKIPPRLSRDPTPDSAPSPRRPTALVPPGRGDAPPSPAAVALLPRRRRRHSSLAGGAPSHGGLPSPAKLCELGHDVARCAGTAGPGCIAWGLGRPRGRYLPLLISVSSSCVGCWMCETYLNEELIWMCCTCFFACTC